jgi:AcrR family transcriptional regulator
MILQVSHSHCRAAMIDRRNPKISPRKQPKQARSNDLVAIILEAALQVLAKEGAHRFTTTRVAEKAGVSIGSLYQYFPNKAAILFRLQSDEWRQTSDLLCGILEEVERPPLERLRRLVHAFVRSECEEADMRVALNDAAPLYRDAPEAQEARVSGSRTMQAFMRSVLPDVPKGTRTRAADLITTTLSAVGKQFSEQPRTAAEIEDYADAMADMFCAYLGDLRARGGPRKRRPEMPRR